MNDAEAMGGCLVLGAAALAGLGILSFLAILITWLAGARLP